MDLIVFMTSLSQEEKNELFILLANELVNESIDKLTSIDDFCNEKKISTRLKNALKENKEFLGLYIESINIRKLRRIMNIGPSTVREFIKLRGY